MAGVVFIMAPTLTGAGTGLLFAYKLHASGASPLYRLVGELGLPWWTGPLALAAATYAVAKLVIRCAPTLCPNGAFHKGGRELIEAMAMPVALGVLVGWGAGALVGDASALGDSGLPAGYVLVPLSILLCSPCIMFFCCNLALYWWRILQSCFCPERDLESQTTGQLIRRGEHV